MGATDLKTKHDFSGYATKANRKCTDGRTIMPEAFKHMDGMQVPLVWQHGHSKIENVLGHAVLEARDDGVYAYGFFNETDAGKTAKKIVQSGNIKALSIYANQLVEKAKQVFHGQIRELSLVLSGANPGAFIDNVAIEHADGEVEHLLEEAIIYGGEELEHTDSDTNDEELEHTTLQEVYDTFTEDQQSVVHYMIGKALEAASAGDKEAEHSDTPTNNGDPAGNEGDLDEEGIQHMNLFDKNSNNGGAATETHELTHDAMHGIMASAEKLGSLKDAVESYALEHGITNLEILFPDAKNLTNTPQWDKRRTEWVAGVLGACSKTPFSRIKTVWADLTADEARAKGYVKGAYKKEEWFSVAKRTTGPTTVYKKQKLDRNDIIDITDFDVVVWMKGEMRLMLEEEIARAILISDGREVDDEDKIADPMNASSGDGLRSIINEHELFKTDVFVNIDDANSSMMEVVDRIIESMQWYKGTGRPTFYTTLPVVTKMLLQRDGFDKRMWRNREELASELGVAAIVEVEVMETNNDLVGILVNLADYNIGADKGGETTMFDDFDIDYNQYKYLIETRISGALTRIKSAIAVWKTAGTDVLVAPTEPTFNAATGVITVPAKTGVVYKDGAGTTLTAGAQTALAPGASKTVNAFPASGYFFASDEDDSWTYKRDAA
jgi:hypothetical protein